MNSKRFSAFLIGMVVFIRLACPASSAEIPDPVSFFGHKPGADRQLIRWEKIHEYFQLLGHERQLQVTDDSVDNRVFGQERDDLHPAPALRADQRVHFKTSTGS